MALPSPAARGGRLRLLAAIARLDAPVLVQRGAGFVTGLVALVARVRRKRFVYSSASTSDFDRNRVLRGRRRSGCSGSARGWPRPSWSRATSRPTSVSAAGGGRRRSSARSPSPRPCDAKPRSRSCGSAGSRPTSAPRRSSSWPRGFPARASSSWRRCRRSIRRPSPAPRRAPASSRTSRSSPPRSRSALAELYDRAVAVVSTSEFEGMPNTLLEGWARGVPALVLSHDPDGLIARHGLGWCAGDSVDRLAALAQAAWSERDDQAAIAAPLPRLHRARARPGARSPRAGSARSGSARQPPDHPQHRRPDRRGRSSFAYSSTSRGAKRPPKRQEQAVAAAVPTRASGTPSAGAQEHRHAREISTGASSSGDPPATPMSRRATTP